MTIFMCPIVVPNPGLVKTLPWGNGPSGMRIQSEQVLGRNGREGRKEDQDGLDEEDEEEPSFLLFFVVASGFLEDSFFSEGAVLFFA